MSRVTRSSAVIIAVIVAAIATDASGGTAKTSPLYAWAVVWHKPVVGVSKVGQNDDRGVARHVAPGRYRLDIVAQSDLAFHLSGPGVDRQTKFTQAYGQRVHEVWSIRLKRGRYRYSGTGVYANQLHADGVKTSGSFAVP